MLWKLDHGDKASLQSQIAGCVRRAVASGELTPGDRLPPAAELAEAMEVDRNTVLTAFRALRDEGLLEFQRGRGVRVSSGAESAVVAVEQAARRLVDLARTNGYPRADLVRLIEELA